MKVIEVVETAPGDLGAYMARAKVDRISDTDPVVDIKFLKRAILEIERTDPEAKSIRISPVDYYASGIVFVGLSTKKQEEEAERTGQNIIHAMAPLTVHVGTAERFDDVDPQVFLDQTPIKGEEDPQDPANRELYRFDLVEEAPEADEQQPKKKQIVAKQDGSIQAPPGYKKPRRGKSGDAK